MPWHGWFMSKKALWVKLFNRGTGGTGGFPFSMVIWVRKYRTIYGYPVYAWMSK